MYYYLYYALVYHYYHHSYSTKRERKQKTNIFFIIICIYCVRATVRFSTWRMCVSAVLCSFLVDVHRARANGNKRYEENGDASTITYELCAYFHCYYHQYYFSVCVFLSFFYLVPQKPLKNDLCVSLIFYFRLFFVFFLSCLFSVFGSVLF